MYSVSLTSPPVRQLPAVRSLGRHLVCNYLVPKSYPRLSALAPDIGAVLAGVSGDPWIIGTAARPAVDRGETWDGDGTETVAISSVSRVNAAPVKLDGVSVHGNMVDLRRTVIGVNICV